MGGRFMVPAGFTAEGEYNPPTYLSPRKSDSPITVSSHRYTIFGNNRRAICGASKLIKWP